MHHRSLRSPAAPSIVRPLWIRNSIPTAALSGIASWIRRGRGASARGDAARDDEREYYNTHPAGKPAPGGHLRFLSVRLAQSLV
jgi:hypothetical protein